MAGTVTLWIPGPLPGMNEIVAAAKGSGGKGMGYATMKRIWTEAVWAYARSAGIHRGGPFVGPVSFRFLWRERDRRRDKDNVVAARKFVIDGLVAAQVIHKDGWRFVSGWIDDFAIDAATPGVLVEIREVSP